MSLPVKPPLVIPLVTHRGPEPEGVPRGRAFWSAFSLQQLPHLPLAKRTLAVQLPCLDGASLSQGEHKHEKNEHFYNVQSHRRAFLLQFSLELQFNISSCLPTTHSDHQTRVSCYGLLHKARGTETSKPLCTCEETVIFVLVTGHREARLAVFPGM